MRNRTRMTLATALLLGLFSCSGKVSIGDLGGGSPGSQGSLGSPGPAGSGGWPPTKCGISGGGIGGGWVVSGAVDASLVGTWVGHLQVSLPAGSPTAKLVITGGNPPGYVVFGDGSAPPPATNPDVGYPPDMPQGGGGGPGYWIEPGFQYHLVSGDVTAQRVKLSGASNELWKGWCRLQTSYSGGRNEPCACLPNTNSRLSAGQCSLVGPKNQKLADVDCGKLGLCLDYVPTDPCACFAKGCYARLNLDISFDLARGTDVMMGTLQGPFGKSAITLSRL